MTTDVKFIRHEWDAPPGFSVQQLPRSYRAVVWAQCARCMRLVATSADFEMPKIILPGQTGVPTEASIKPLVDMLARRLAALSQCPGKPDTPPPIGL